MAFGVQVTDECKTAFTELKLGHKYRFIIYALSSDLKKIEVVHRAEPSQCYDDMVGMLKDAEQNGECRYAVFDAEYKKGDQTLNKLLFLAWSPDNAKIKQKMVYASSKDALKRALGEGLGVEIQANDHGDLAWESCILEKINRNDRH